MTGYGKSEAILENGKLTIEFRSVNGKNADISIKSSLLPKDKEIEIRKRIADKLQRGTIDMFITWEPNAAENAKTINADLAKEYYSQIAELGRSIGAVDLNRDNPNYLLSTLLRMPDVIDSSRRDIITEDNWQTVDKAIDEALDRIDRYRSDEGVSLYKDVTGRVQNILDLYDKIEEYEPERISAARERILKAAEELQIKLDEQRFEQEMIFYLEKLDINEERVRLRQHCKYFIVFHSPQPGQRPIHFAAS